MRRCKKKCKCNRCGKNTLLKKVQVQQMWQKKVQVQQMWQNNTFKKSASAKMWQNNTFKKSASATDVTKQHFF